MFGSKEQPAEPATPVVEERALTYGEEQVIQLRKDLVKALRRSATDLGRLYGQQGAANELFNIAAFLAKRLPEEPK